MCLAPVCFNIRVLHDRMRAVSSQTLRTLWNHHDSCLMSLDRSAPTSGHPHRVFLHGGAKSICYSSITELRTTALISILDNFSLDHCHWVSHSESKCQAFLYKAARCSPQSRIKPLFSPLFPLSPTAPTSHRFVQHPRF